MKNIFKITFMHFFSLIVVSKTLLASTNGYDYKNDTLVEFEDDCFYEGDALYMYDFIDESYHFVIINNLNTDGDNVKIDIYDNTKEEERYIDLIDNICD